MRYKEEHRRGSSEQDFCFDKTVFNEDVCEHLRYLKDDFDNMLATP